MSTGDSIVGAIGIGADMAYMGTRFIATEEANADADYKQEIVESSGKDIVYSSLFTGVHGNYLRGSIVKAGMDPDDLPTADKTSMNFGSGGNTDKKAWKDIWGAGQGVGTIDSSPSVEDVVDTLETEFNAALARLSSQA
jgi:nitronate monooxygenase